MWVGFCKALRGCIRVATHAPSDGFSQLAKLFRLGFDQGCKLAFVCSVDRHAVCLLRLAHLAQSSALPESAGHQA